MPVANDRFGDIIESYYLETGDRLFFAVKGSVHPPDQFISVLRYAPDPENGDRVKDGITYRRLYHFREQEQMLRSSHAQYLTHDPVFRATLQSVPRFHVRRVYDPRERMIQLAGGPFRSAPEEDAVAFARVLEKAAGVPLSAIGITGSLLIGLHKDSSDLDLSIFGAEKSRKVCCGLGALLDDGSMAELTRLDRNGLEDLYRQRVSDTNMDFADFAKVEMRKRCQGSFRGRPFFIRFLRLACEAGEQYGEFHYRKIGRATITATIADDQDAIFTPCRYVLSDVCIESGVRVGITEIVSFRGRFCEQARIGESIAAAGTVEQVESTSGNVRYRLLLGNAPEDTMTILSQLRSGF